MAVDWGIVATVREDLETIKRFVAHYRIIGAREMHIFFDDPEDPAADIAATVPGVFVTRCDAAHWSGQRPRRHQRRQRDNANRAYAQAGVDWLIHLDGDELLHSEVEIAGLLSAVDDGVDAVRVSPAEAMEFKRKGGVSVFRRPLPDGRRGRRLGERVWGDIAPLLSRGLLSHDAGKYFVRTGIDGARLSIHQPWLGEARMPAGELPEADLLHFHGGDADRWIASVERRIETGAYRASLHDDRRRAGKLDGLGRAAYLRRLAETEGEEGLRRFHARVARFGPDKRPLRRAGLILQLRLWLDEKVETVFPGSCEVAARDVAREEGAGALTGSVEVSGVRMRVALDGNWTETCLAMGRPAEAAEMEEIAALVAGRRVLFWDVGANAGLYSLIVARHAAPGSRIHAFEPNPVMAARFERNVALNGFSGIELHRCALGDRDGTAALHVGANLGEATLRDVGGPAITVPLRRLTDFVDADRGGAEVTLLKIDIEGAEPDCLRPVFEAVPESSWPDAILYEHAHSEHWGVAPEDLFPSRVYRQAQRFRTNSLLVRMPADALEMA